MSQELQTPLTSIQLGTNLLLDAREHPLTDLQKRLVTIVSKEGCRLIDLVNSLVDLPKKEAQDDYEKSYLIHLLEICKGNVSRAAKLVGKYRADFYDIMKNMA